MGVVTTDRVQATEWLNEAVQPGTAPALPPGAVDAALDMSRVVDPEGRAPVDDGYVDTFSVYYAAALLLEQKAGQAIVSKVARVSSFTSEGSSVTKTEGSSAVDFRGLAAYYRGLAFPSGDVHVIDLGPALGPVPRSAYEGVTPDDHRW